MLPANPTNFTTTTGHLPPLHNTIHHQPVPGRQLRWLQYEAGVLTLQLQGNPISNNGPARIHVSYIYQSAFARFAGNNILVALLPNKNQLRLILDINDAIQANIAHDLNF